MTAEVLVSIAEFEELSDRSEFVVEYDNGRVLERGCTSHEHGYAQGMAFSAYSGYSAQSGFPLAISQNAGYWILPNVLRAPYVSVTARARFDAMAKRRGARVGCPDLAIEVVSPNDTAFEINLKVGQYLEGGAEAVWTLYTDSREVWVYHRNGDCARCGELQDIEEPVIAPGLRIRVGSLFFV
jgi:Uma2 family endonuclease